MSSHIHHHPTLSAGLAADCPRCIELAHTGATMSPGFDDRAERIEEIRAYLDSPAARWAPCGSLDGLDDELEWLERSLRNGRLSADELAEKMRETYQSAGAAAVMDYLAEHGDNVSAERIYWAPCAGCDDITPMLLNLCLVCESAVTPSA